MVSGSRGGEAGVHGFGDVPQERDLLMRMIILLIGLIIALIWIGVEIRPKQKPASNVLFAFAALFTILLVGAVYDIL